MEVINCNKSKISEQFHTLPTFWNWRDAFNKGSLPRKRLFDKDKSKRCLIWHTTRQTLKKIYLFSMEGNLFEFPCLCFGLGPAPLIFTKLPKVPIALLRRVSVRIIIFLDDILVRNFARKEDIDFSVTKFAFCDKF